MLGVACFWYEGKASSASGHTSKDYPLARCFHILAEFSAKEALNPDYPITLKNPTT